MATDSAEVEEQYKRVVEEWSSNSNECFTIELLLGDGSSAGRFRPEFTYPIFGEEEAIFGYQALFINLSFAAHNLKPHLAVSYDKKWNVGNVEATDIHGVLRDFLPDAAFSNQSWIEALKDGYASEFTPPGEKVHEYSRVGHKYEIWCASLSDPAARQLLENMQVLVPMFIEGGTMLQLEQDWTTQRWKLFLLYHLRPKPDAGLTYSKYSLVGYATSYRVFTFPDRHNPSQSDRELFVPSDQSLLDILPSPDTESSQTTNNLTSPLDLPSRERLSQFLILPPYQHAGHGQELYNTLYTHLTSQPNIHELTVEDPNEAFDDLRDLCDLLYLRSHNPTFSSLRIKTTIPTDQLLPTTPIPTHLIVPLPPRQEILRTTKLQPRQFDRLVEMHTLSHIPASQRSRSRITRKEKASNENDRAYYFWRLYVKQRLYIFNRDQLAQLEREERIERVEAAVDSVLEGYVKMIERVEKRERVKGVNGDGEVVVGAAKEGTPRKRLGKRKVVDEDEESEDVETGEETRQKVVAVNGHKKARVEE